MQTGRNQVSGQIYYDTVSKMQTMKVDPEYVQGWVGGFLHNPKREEQRVTEAYEAGYSDGEGRETAAFERWIQAG
jgi:hypothetical protein